MDTREYIDTRRKRYLAQMMEEFEEHVEAALALDPSDPEDRPLIEGVHRFKATARKKMQALATDCIDVLPNSDFAINAHAVAIGDRLVSQGRP